MADKLTVNSDASLDEAIELLRQSYAEYKCLDLDIKVKGKKRTGQQRKSLEVYCDAMAARFNEAGIDYVKWLDYKAKKGIEAVWTQELFKDLFRDYAAALYPEIVRNGKASTSRLKRDQMTKAYDLVNMRMSIIFGVGMQWPSED